MPKMGTRREQGVMLLEALIAILIFSIGILSMVAMQGLAITYTSDAKYRSDASFLADEIIGQIWVDRANIANYVLPGGTAPELAIWMAKLNSALPQSDVNLPTIAIDVPSGTVDVTIQWQQPGSASVRNYRSIAIVTNP